MHLFQNDDIQKTILVSDKNDDNDDINHKILKLILFSLEKFSINKNRWTICTFFHDLVSHLYF